MTTDSTALFGRRTPEEVRAAENFPVALRILPASIRRHLHALYQYARFLDDVGDEPTQGLTTVERLNLLDRFEAEVRRLYRGERVQHPVLRAVAPTVVACRLPVEPLLRLIEANRVDQVVTRYATVDHLVEYCALSANPVGELVLHVFGQASPERIAWSDRICTALQLIEHLQDVPEDHRRGRVYLPKTDLDSFGVPETDLAATTASSALRALIGFEAERAHAWLEAGAPLITTLRGWARAAVAGYVAGGRATLKALERSGYDPLPGPPRPRRRDVFTDWLATMARSAG